MKRFFMSVLAIFFPWLVLLIYDNPGGALIALVMQATIIAWIPASVWAWRLVRQETKAQKAATKEEKVSKEEATQKE